MENKKLRLFETAALIALCVALCVGTWAQGRQERLSEGLVRLHVLAHSNDAYEQRLKLSVRDAVLEYLEGLLPRSGSRRQAEQVISENLEKIARTAASAAKGRAVTVSLGTEHYPTREYEGFALPAGEYRSLRIELGEGQGENWWCVVFPPLCLPAAEGEGLSPVMQLDDMALISRQGGYRLGFRSIELWQQLKDRIKSTD